MSKDRRNGAPGNRSAMRVNSTLMPGTEAFSLGVEEQQVVRGLPWLLGACVIMMVSSTSEMMPTLALAGMVYRLALTGLRLATL